MTRDGTTVVALGVIWKDEIELGVHESGAITVQVNDIGYTGKISDSEDAIELCKALLRIHGISLYEEPLSERETDPFVGAGFRLVSEPIEAADSDE